jgi:hypothetical protein
VKKNSFIIPAKKKGGGAGGVGGDSGESGESSDCDSSGESLGGSDSGSV